MKYIFVVWGFLLLAAGLPAQTVKVTDADTGEPMIGVQIINYATSSGTFTDELGRGDLGDLAQLDTIHFQYLGYQTQVLSFSALKKQKFKVKMAEDQIFIGPPIIIESPRWDLKAQNSSAKVSQISRREVRLQNPQTAADMLGRSGEIFVQKSQQGGGSPMIRGFAANRLLYTVDGVRMNTAIFRSGNLQNVISLDPFAMEEAEVLFGPGSIIYGSDAIGGVMGFQTLRPNFQVGSSTDVSGNAVVRYSSANQERTGHLDLHVGRKKWASITSVSGNRYGDLRMGTNGPAEYLRPTYVARIDGRDTVLTNSDPRRQVPTGYDQFNVMQKFRFLLAPRVMLDYGFHWSETSEFGRYDRHLQLQNGTPRYGEWRYGPQQWMMHTLQLQSTKRTKLWNSLSARLAYQRFGESRINRRFNDPLRQIRTEQVDAYSANLDLKKSLGPRHNLLYGFEAVFNDVASVGLQEHIVSGETQPAQARYPESTWGTYAAYLSDMFDLTNDWKLQGGIRYSNYRMFADFSSAQLSLPFTDALLSDGSLNGNVGVIYAPNFRWRISGNLSTGFRAPNVDDLGKIFDSEPGAVVVPNPDLRAEYAYNGDFNVAKVFGEYLKLDLSGFYTYLDNALVRRDFTLNGQDSILYEGELSRVQAIQNAAQADVYGFQAGIEISLREGWLLSTRYNFQRGMEETDDGIENPSRHAAPAFGVTRVTYSRDRWKVVGMVEYAGKKEFEELPIGEQNKPHLYAIDDNGDPWSPAWYVLSLKGELELSEGWLLNLGLENITNQRYRPFSSGLVAPGRNLVVSTRYSF